MIAQIDSGQCGQLPFGIFEVSRSAGCEVDVLGGPRSWDSGQHTQAAFEHPLGRLALGEERVQPRSADDGDVDGRRPRGGAGGLGDVGLIVTDGRGIPHALIATTRVDVVPFDEVSAEHAFLEGEGDRSLATSSDTPAGRKARRAGNCAVTPSTVAMMLACACRLTTSSTASLSLKKPAL